ncbi:MAG: hypothetical protein RLZZ548_1137, partial [Bacteroidota bacterium]
VGASTFLQRQMTEKTQLVWAWIEKVPSRQTKPISIWVGKRKKSNETVVW